MLSGIGGFAVHVIPDTAAEAVIGTRTLNERAKAPRIAPPQLKSILPPTSMVVGRLLGGSDMK